MCKFVNFYNLMKKSAKLQNSKKLIFAQTYIKVMVAVATAKHAVNI